MSKIIINKTQIGDEIYPLMYLLDEHNHPIEIIDIIEACRGQVADICTVKKVMPNINGCIGKLQNSGEMCYLPFSRIKDEAFIVRHSDKKIICEEDQLTVYIFKPAKDDKYCLVNCEPKRESFVFKEDISEIICESEDDARLVKESLGGLLKSDSEDRTLSIRVYQDESYPMKDMYGLDKALSELGKNRIYLKSGGNICIDRTTAATLIDVNSGNSSGKADFVKVNVEAAIEIARQIRLKNIVGQVVVDFINMDEKSDRDLVIKALNDASRSDRAKVRLFGFTAMGLFEMTRGGGVTGFLLENAVKTLDL